MRSTPGTPRKDGSKVEYVRLAHNVWDSERGRSQVRVIHTLGRSDRLDAEAMRRLVGTIVRYLDGRRYAGNQLRDDAGAGLRVLFALVANRAKVASSKRAALEWAAAPEARTTHRPIFQRVPVRRFNPTLRQASELITPIECILRSVRATVPLSGEPLFRGGLSHCDVAD